MDKNEELQKWLNDERYIQRSYLMRMWNLGASGVNTFLSRNNIKPIKRIVIGGRGRYFFYDKQQCISARSMLAAKAQEAKRFAADNSVVTIKDLAMLWGISNNTTSVFIHYRKIQPIKRIGIHGQGWLAFYDRAECERARPFINKPEQKEVEKVENIGELATATKHQILNETGADNFVWDKVTIKHKIMPVKNYCDERGNFVSLFKKDETVSAILAYKNEQKQLLEKCLADDSLVTSKQLEKIWNCKNSNIHNKIYALKIKPHVKIKLENGYLWHFYKKSDCIESQQSEKMEEKQMELPEPKEQTPDIIPADTIDLFTMSELESELKNRGVELTADVRAKINASDMPEMQHIATMLRGNAKTIAIRLSVLNEIAGQLREVEPEQDDEEDQEVFYSYHQASELLGISMGSLRNKVSALGMILHKKGVKAYFTINQIESLRKDSTTQEPSEADNTIGEKFSFILNKLEEIENQIAYHKHFDPIEDVISRFKSAIQSRSNVLSALMSRAKIVICHESCVILLDQKFAVDKVGESQSKEMINNALVDIGCKDFNIYVLFSGKQDVKNNQEK